MSETYGRTWVAPPGWPAPPPGWTPHDGWQPDPAWGPAPPGWQFWQDGDGAPEQPTADLPPAWSPPPGGNGVDDAATTPSRRGPTRKDVGRGLAAGLVLLLAVVGLGSLLPGGDDEPVTVRTAGDASASPSTSPTSTPSASPPPAAAAGPDAAVPPPSADPAATRSPLPVPVLDDAAVQACAVFAGNVRDVVTKQDRSNLARAVNRFARSSAEPQVVAAGASLTDHADSWTGFLWSVAKTGFADVCTRGAAASSGGPASVPGPAPGPGTAPRGPSGADVVEPEPQEPVTEVPAEPAPESPQCLEVGPAVLERIASRPAEGVGDLVLPSAWSLPGEHGHVVGGFLSSAGPEGGVDGEFGTWFLPEGGDVHAYSDAALTLTAWPVADGRDASGRVAGVRACAEAAAG